ncbi:MAG TPA: PP2C family protein-serine/threonine phosphatase [Kofleriaceae bacterium]
MQELWSSASYSAHLLSLPFALAPVAMVIVIAYVAVMRGAPMLRFWLLAHCMSLLPYAVTIMLSPSIVDGVLAQKLFQVAAAFIPMAAATGGAFQLTLLRKTRRMRWFIWLGTANAMVWVIVSSTSTAAISGVQHLNGLWYPLAGKWAWLALVNTFFLTLPGFISLGQAAVFGKPGGDRRQQRAVLLANLITYSGLVDVLLAYRVGLGVVQWPLGWLLSGIGSLLVLRALVVEDLLRVRAIDTTAPMLVFFFAAAMWLGWLVLEQLGPPLPWWAVAVALAMTFGAVRASVATVQLVQRGGRGNEGPLERLLAQLVGRARNLTQAPPIAELAVDVVQLGLGVRPQIFLAAEEDWGWLRSTGERLADDLAPDPLLLSWLADHRAVLFADDLEPVPADLHETTAQLFKRNDARALVAVGNTDELLALIVIPANAPRLRGGPLEFLERCGERLADALMHARMARRAAERANLAREVELAATVQSELLPTSDPQTFRTPDAPAITVVGSWQPATRCAGDFWDVFALGDGRVLVVIGDVTGHGVASAMVTAAAAGACDVCVRRSGTTLDLGELTTALDAAVRRVGGGQLAMTCAAAILDPKANEVRFVSCGHTAPYLCRPGADKIELQALVGRGNPLGTGVATVPRVLTKAIQPGDLIVWYTDGVIDAQDPAGTPFGDRRLQQLLRRLDKTHLSSPAVHDLVQAGIAAHRAGRPLADDETVIVASLEAA